MKKERNDLVVFLVGIIMLAAGLYWFTSSVTVNAGFYSFRLLGTNTGGLVIIPFLVGVCWIFANPKSIGAKLVLVIGLVIVLSSVVAGTRFIFRNRNLYEYIVMLVFICGGASLALKVLLAKPKDQDTINRDLEAKVADYDRIKNELDDLKRNIK
ncbi:UNVERIFIED_CONTAM: hypothetical protein Cloal_3147 [Acetivibrio alkalicellulosi]